MKNKLYEAAKAVLYGWASRLTRPRSEWNEKLQALADAISAYEQEQPEAIAGEKTTYETALDYLSEMGYGSGTNFTSKGVASLLADFASQQTSAKDKEIAELEDALLDIIQVNEWKEKYGEDERYLQALPVALKNAKKLIQKQYESKDN